MTADTTPGLEPIRLDPLRRVSEYRAGEITVCRSSEDGGLYTVLRVRERAAKLMLVGADAKMRENGGESCFSILKADGEDLIAAAPHVQQRRLVDFAAPSCPSVGEKVGLCLRLVRACMASGMPWWLLYLCLTRENVQMCPGGAVKLDLLIDLDGVDGRKDERDCARRCGSLIHEILGKMTEKEKRRSNAYLMAEMMERNDSYTTLLQLHRDLDAVLKNPARTPSISRLLSRGKKHTALIIGVLRITAAAFALAIILTLLKSFVFSDISLPSFRYEGLDQIGGISLGE